MRVGIFFDLKIEHKEMKGFHQLSFILMDPLDLHIKKSVGIEEILSSIFFATPMVKISILLNQRLLNQATSAVAVPAIAAALSRRPAASCPIASLPTFRPVRPA